MTGSGTSTAGTRATIVGTVLQLAMVLSGHWVPAIKENGFAIGGVAISAIAAVMYARRAGLTRGRSATGGALVGGLCALIGIVVSFALGDVPAMILAVGTASSAVAGAIAGAIAGKRAG